MCVSTLTVQLNQLCHKKYKDEQNIPTKGMDERRKNSISATKQRSHIKLWILFKTSIHRLRQNKDHLHTKFTKAKIKLKFPHIKQYHKETRTCEKGSYLTIEHLQLSH